MHMQTMLTVVVVVVVIVVMLTEVLVVLELVTGAREGGWMAAQKMEMQMATRL